MSAPKRPPKARQPRPPTPAQLTAALVNGAAGAVAPHGRVFPAMACTVTGGKIVQIDAHLDPERLAQFDLNISPIINRRP